jgi:hypothetical protein
VVQGIKKAASLRSGQFKYRDICHEKVVQEFGEAGRVGEGTRGSTKLLNE